MLKANALEKISSDLYKYLESFEYVELCNFLREEIEMNIPQFKRHSVR